jgi:hypothetical protein
MDTPAPKRTRTYTHWGAYDVEVAGGSITAAQVIAPTILPD